MNSKKFNKLVLASAVSVAICGPAFAEEEFEESLQAIKVSNYGEQLIVNAVVNFSDGNVSETFIESALLNRADALPSECDPLSAHPPEESSNDNPDFELTGDWQATSELYLFDLEDDNMEDDDMEDDDAEDDDMEDDDMEDDDMEDDDAEDDDAEDDDMEDDEIEDDEIEDDEMEDEDSEDELEDEGEYQQYLSLSTDGFIVLSEYEESDGIGSCEVTYLGELVGDTYTASPK